MKVSCSPYQLKFRSGGVREGALLRFTFPDGSYGYSDCHPWVEFGDLPLDEQLDALAEGHYTPLLNRSFYYAEQERNARVNGESLFKNLSLPKSHQQVKLGDESFFFLQKIKLKPHQAKAFLKWANPKVTWRLDFNASFTATECEEFLKRAKHLKIDFIEDPFPYHEDHWRSFQEQYGVAFAEDFEKGEEAQVSICKPAVRTISQSAKRRVVTSYLDHPIGQLAALYSAAIDPELSKEAGGFLSHTLYEANAFSDRLTICEERLIPPTGIGWGYDKELEALQWK